MLVTVLGVLGVMLGMMLSVMLGGMFMMFMGMHRVAVSQVSVMRSGMMITSLVMSMSFAMVVRSGFVMKRGMMMVIVFGHRLRSWLRDD